MQNVSPARRGIRGAIGEVALVIALSLALFSFAPALAHADTQNSTIAEQLRSANEQIDAQGFTTAGSNAHNWLENDPTANVRNALFPSSFDLRDNGVVTPVKLQNPWGTCWGFAAIASSETSILSELKNNGQDYSASSPYYDLSERQLAWFAYSPIPDNDPNGQGGEGQVHMNTDPNAPFNTGGLPVFATSIFSSGIGPLYERTVPYKNDEGLIEYAPITNEEGGYEFDEDGNIKPDMDKPLYYSAQGTWAVTNEELRYAQVIELEGTNTLPVPATFEDTNHDGNTTADEYRYNASATDAIKQELLEGRAVSIAFCADQSLPGQVTEQGYMNPDTWAHYTYEPAQANHAVTIVGWDDNYAASNFTEGKQPDHDGAWIVKNSWGAKDNAFPNQMDWGVNGSGYFYLSYYDQSISIAETFDYNIESTQTEAESYYNNAYDYLPTSTSFNETSTDEIATANVFAAEGDQTVRTLTCETALPNTQVTYQLYKLDPNYSNPTDGTLIAEVSEVYEYGGFHRVDLPDNMQLKVEQGGMFSVVVTQKSGDNYYYTLDGGYNKAYTDLYNKALEEQYQKIYGPTVEQVALSSFQSDYGRDPVDGNAEDEALMQEYRDAIWDLLKAFGFISYVETYSHAVVNEGESLLYQNGQWLDETAVIDTLGNDTQYIDFDNFSIKAYSDDTPLADEDLVTELGGTIESAEVLVGSVNISTDGSDVPSDEYWVTQESADSLNDAIKQAQEIFDSAKADWTQVTDAQLNEALDNLNNAMNAFQTAEQAGLLASATSIDDLKKAIDDAQAYLEATSISVDGSDVATGSRWASQQAVDTFKVAIDAARSAAEAERPTQNDIDSAKQALADAYDAFKEACSNGTAAISGNNNNNNESNDNNGMPTPDKKGGLAQTGDAFLWAPIVLAIVLISALVIAVIAYRSSIRRRN